MYSAGIKAFTSLSTYVTATEAIFSKLTLAGPLLVKNSCTEFHEILTSVLTDDIMSQTGGRTGVISAKSADGSLYLAFLARGNTLVGFALVRKLLSARDTNGGPAPCCHVRLAGVI
jgi:hypothetical protein